MSGSDLHSLVLGSLVLSGAGSAPVDGYAFYVEGEGVDFGDADSEARVIASALMDGDLESIERTGNKTISLSVIIEGEDADALARGEAALDLECLTARELLWTPPAANGATSVYDVQWARTKHDFDDLREMDDGGQLPQRHMTLEARAYPFPRATTEVVAEAIGTGTDTETVTPVATSIYSGANTTGWTYRYGPSSAGTIGAVAAASGGGVRNATVAPTSWGTLEYGTPFSMGANRWLAVVFDADKGKVAPIRLTWGGMLFTFSPTAQVGSTAYYLLPIAGMTISRLVLLWTNGGTLAVRSISRQDVMPVQSTGRQLVRQFTVQGSARTQGSIHLSHTAMALGSSLIYTWKADGSGYVPTIDTYLNTSLSAPRVPDSSGQAALGGYMTINASAAAVYEPPANLIPEGTYNVLVRAKHPSAAAAGVVVYAKFETILNGAVVGSQSMFESMQWTNADYRVLSVGAPVLPSTRIANGSTAKVRVTITTSGPDLRLDSVYLCNSDLGDLTLLDCGDALPVPGGASNHAWIDTQTIESPYAATWVGTQPDRSDARHIDGLKTVPTQGHALAPGQNSMFTVSRAFGIAAEVRHYPRARSNVAKVVA